MVRHIMKLLETSEVYYELEGPKLLYFFFLIYLQIDKLVNCMKKVLEKPGLQILHVEQE